jgi:hypothetical protein
MNKNCGQAAACRTIPHSDDSAIIGEAKRG